VLGCLGLAIFGHRTILDVAIGLCALGVATTFWRNRRRLQRLQRIQPPPDRDRDPDPRVAITGRGAAREPSGAPGDRD
jgi:hypothetical protein